VLLAPSSSRPCVTSPGAQEPHSSIRLTTAGTRPAFVFGRETWHPRREARKARQAGTAGGSRTYDCRSRRGRRRGRISPSTSSSVARPCRRCPEARFRASVAGTTTEQGQHTVNPESFSSFFTSGSARKGLARSSRCPEAFGLGFGNGRGERSIRTSASAATASNNGNLDRTPRARGRRRSAAAAPATTTRLSTGQSTREML